LKTLQVTKKASVAHLGTEPCVKEMDLTIESEYIKSVIVQWIGDISLNEQLCNPQYHELIRESMDRLGHEAGPCDLRVGNFEAPIWGDGSVNRLRKTRICTTEQAAKCILPLGLDVVFLGNNHVYDCREKGFENTTKFLRENGIRFLGAGTSRDEASQPVILERRGLTLGFLNYVHRNTNPDIPLEAGVFLNYFDEEVALEEISEMSRKVHVLLLYLHWGSQELIRLPSLAQRRFGRRAIETGATVVVFDHAHCLQPHEDWCDGHIFYGLGNFVFGDLPGKKWSSLACRTAMANIEISRECVEKTWLAYMCSENGIPNWDKRKSRSRSQELLNFYIHFSDRVYRILYGWEKFYQSEIAPCFLFIKKSGGIIPSLFKIRKRHFSKFFGGLTRPFRGIG